MAWGRDTPEKRAALELDVRRKLMATEKKAAKDKPAKDKGDKSGKGKK